MTAGDARDHYGIGRALAPLAGEGVLVIGSGAITHALGEIRDWTESGGTAPAWVDDFADAVHEALSAGDVASVLAWEQLPSARRNHPSPEHLMPLFTALGAAGCSPVATRVHRSVDRSVLRMDAWSFRQRR